MKRHRYRNIVAAVHGSIWAILPEKLDQICALLDERGQGIRLSKDEIQARIGTPQRPGAAIAGNKLAVLDLFGVLSQRMTMMEQISGGTSMEAFGKAFDAAVADESVKAIVLNIDSPGGTVAGTPELAAKIKAARGTKPIVAVANMACCSAAYWIASAADEVVASPSAMVGSIGAMRVHTETSGMDAKAGIKRTIITSAKYKADGNSFEPMSETAMKDGQAKIDAAGQAFVDAVAANRGITAASVLANFGQGRWFFATEAQSIGMVDRIATLDQVLSEFGVGAGSAGMTAAAGLSPAFSLENVSMDKRIFERLVVMGLCKIDATQADAETALRGFFAGKGLVAEAAPAFADAEKVLQALGETKPAAPKVELGPQPPVAMSSADILAAVRLSPLSDDRKLALGSELISAGGSLSVSQILDRINKESAGVSKPIGATTIEHLASERDKFTQSARDAVLCATPEFAGAMPKEIFDRRKGEMVEFKPSGSQRQLSLQSPLGIGRRCLAVAGLPQAQIDNLSPLSLAQILCGSPLHNHGIFAASDGPAFNVSGMFSNILLDAQNVLLRRSYMEAQTTFQRWMRQGEPIRDFKPVHKIIAGELGDPKAIPEDGQFEETTLTDGKESYRLVVWGEVFSVSWQTIVNDQLSAFTRIPAMQGQAMRRKQNKLAYGVMLDNAALSDTGLLFNATAVTTAGGHNNLATGAATPTVATLNAQYKRMAEMPGLSAGTVLNIEPRFIIAPPALRGTVLQLLNSTADPASTNAGVANIWENSLQPIIDAQLGASVTGGSDTAWYLAASYNDVDTIEYAYLQGLETPQLDQEVAFDRLAMRHRIYQAFAVKALDFRGLQKHAGV